MNKFFAVLATLFILFPAIDRAAETLPTYTLAEVKRDAKAYADLVPTLAEDYRRLL